MRYPNRIGLIAVALVAALAGRGCVTASPPQVAMYEAPSASSPSGTAAADAAGTASAGAGAGTASADADAVAQAQAADAGIPPTATSSPQTADERRTALDKQLNDSLRAFDAQLQKEQQRTAAERDARQATVAGGSSEASGSAAMQGAEATSGDARGSEATLGDARGTAAAQGADGADATSSGGAGTGARGGKRGDARTTHAGDLKSDRAASAAGGVSGNGAPATMIPDGNDDDIVARRLRRAADVETDPELKDKLWKEYVEYKKNTRVR